MHSRVSNHEASNKQIGCKGELRKIQKKNNKNKSEARDQQLKKKEFQSLTSENGNLEELIECLIAGYRQVPATDLQKQEISVDLSYSHPHSDVKDEEQGMKSDVEGNAEELDGLELDDLRDDNPENSLIIQPNTIAKFLLKIDEDVASNVDFSDFMICFNGEQKTIGRYSFPISLVPTVERIMNTYGDVSASSPMNTNITGKIYLLFSAAIKEMEDLELHQVTETKMLKWRDAIKDALRVNFKVEFAMSHLKKIARAYFGGIGEQVLLTINEKLNSLYKERDKALEGFKDFLATAKDFDGQSVSTGLFP
ncbi:uncharacterized protein LOC108461846 [Gossypium arboreum]|uniref:Fiber Fb17-like protein n=1 Tax=Gossypium arboreum TaxID=29729 RepID=A0ABR0MHL6_GOSAR|nr:uncharacterized protein LOC108461846 [Gossypium arboreum]XP_052880082.1 uncharacterized protein LOC108461846 [Gossypium arboreum]XP_052880083.1 uncharacterized protein LOC108461846 [Gossypium arboreum]KAK5772631.1 hypothetical protein PVK06_048924 [Gossypium arboreum]